MVYIRIEKEDAVRILVVEDERKLANFIKRGLKEASYAVDTAFTGEKGIFLALTNEYDLIILDLMLPDISGIEICNKLRKEKVQASILVLTVLTSLRDKIQGLDSGADDYLTKPFAFEEFLARVRALLRRRNEVKSTILKAGDLVLNQVTREVKRGEKEISLTNKEFALLEYFMIHANQVVTRTMISEHVWNEDFDTFTNVIDVYVNYLRNKVDKGFKKQMIHSIRGTGYILKDK